MFLCMLEALQASISHLCTSVWFRSQWNSANETSCSHLLWHLPSFFAFFLFSCFYLFFDFYLFLSILNFWFLFCLSLWRVPLCLFLTFPQGSVSAFQSQLVFISCFTLVVGGHLCLSFTSLPVWPLSPVPRYPPASGSDISVSPVTFSFSSQRRFQLTTMFSD